MTIERHDAAMQAILGFQDGVITRRQLLDAGWAPGKIRGRLRRGDWVTVYPGTYLTHTGEITWRQRAWAAVLDAGPAALTGPSALTAAGARDQDERVIHIVVDRRRRITHRPGVVVHYRTGLDAQVLWATRPPRVRIEEALLDRAASASAELLAIATLTDAVGARLTTASRLLAAASRRSRLRRRRLIEQVLVDVRDGTCSVLEHGYLTRVERAHGLPTPRRQAPTGVGRPGLRDIDYREYGVVIELDGRGHHSASADRDRDLERDLDAVVEVQRLTLRLGWGQVMGRACSTARKVGRLLNARGWPGQVSPCPACPSPP